MKNKVSNVIHVAEIDHEDFDETIDYEKSAKSCQKRAQTAASAKSRYWIDSDPVCTGEIPFEETQLYTLLKPLFLYMRATGLFYINDSFQKRRKTKRSVFPRIYCICLCLLLIVNLGRSLSGYKNAKQFDDVLLFELMVTCWWTECITKAINAFINCFQKERFFLFLVQFQKACTDETVDQYRKWIKRWMFKFIIQATFFTVFNTVVTAYAMFEVPSLEVYFDTLLAPFTAQSTFGKIMKAFNIFMQLVHSLVAMIPLAFYKTIALILFKEFSLLSNDFSSRIDDNGHFHGDLEVIRMRHQQISKLTEIADNLFNFFIAAAFSANIPMLCILLYGLLYTKTHIAYTILLIFWLVFATGHMLLICIFGALINYKAHAPVSDVYSIHAQSTTTDRQLQVNMFLNRLTGTSIGVTALELFVINKPTLLTILGMLMTYFVVLVQFKAPTSNFTCNCNFNQTLNNSTLI